MSFSLRESFETHSKNYSSRVLDRNKYSNLSLEDELIVKALRQNWSMNEPGILIDAGCGTGDRLRMLFQNHNFPKNWFNQIIGVDFAKGMLEKAKQQYLDGKPLYTKLQLADLIEYPEVHQGDLILCLWGIINGASLDASKLLCNLSRMVAKHGFLVYDVMTTKPLKHLKKQEDELLKSHPELIRDQNDCQVWYQRDDQTIGYLRVFSPNEMNKLAKAVSLKLLEVWGYSFGQHSPSKIEIVNGSINEDEIINYPFLLIFHKND